MEWEETKEIFEGPRITLTGYLLGPNDGLVYMHNPPNQVINSSSLHLS